MHAHSARPASRRLLPQRTFQQFEDMADNNDGTVATRKDLDTSTPGTMTSSLDEGKADDLSAAAEEGGSAQPPAATPAPAAMP